MKLILASQSPRRGELLWAAGMEHEVRPAAIDEAVQRGESPVAYAVRVARDKACAVARAAHEIVLAADTTVVCGGRILGKPRDIADARRMLHLLAGTSHEVITGICLLHRDVMVQDHESTRVWFNPMSEQEIDAYAQSGEPADKAGAYAVQGIASRYIERIEGSYANVVGLPVALVWRSLERIKNGIR